MFYCIKEEYIWWIVQKVLQRLGEDQDTEVDIPTVNTDDETTNAAQFQDLENIANSIHVVKETEDSPLIKQKTRQKDLVSFADTKDITVHVDPNIISNSNTIITNSNNNDVHSGQTTKPNQESIVTPEDEPQTQQEIFEKFAKETALADPGVYYITNYMLSIIYVYILVRQRDVATQFFLQVNSGMINFQQNP